MKMKNPTGIQIIGTQRSGSNLLRVILDQSEEIASPHPPHVLTTFVPLLDLYDLTNAEGYKLLISDIVDFVEANPVPWEGVELDKNQLFKDSQVYSLYELNKLICKQAAISKNASYWCCKSMTNFLYADEIEKAAPGLKYIFLYRDGRDVALSFKKAIVGEKNTYFLAKQWKRDQDACIALSARLDKTRFFSLNYETLIAKPEETIKELCDFLNIAYSSNMMNFYTSKTSKITASSGEMWSNLEKPIITNNTNKFLKEFKDSDLEVFELVAGDTLNKLGYPVYTSMDNVALISAEAIEKYSLENALLKKEAVVNSSKNDLEKREPQALLLKEIKEKYRTQLSNN
jgi:hypothetical protein